MIDTRYETYHAIVEVVILVVCCLVSIDVEDVVNGLVVACSCSVNQLLEILERFFTFDELLHDCCCCRESDCWWVVPAWCLSHGNQSSITNAVRMITLAVVWVLTPNEIEKLHRTSTVFSTSVEMVPKTSLASKKFVVGGHLGFANFLFVCS